MNEVCADTVGEAKRGLAPGFRLAQSSYVITSYVIKSAPVTGALHRRDVHEPDQAAELAGIRRPSRR